MDPRIQTLAKNLIHYSTAIQPGEKVLIEAFDSALPLAKALVEETYRAGGVPFVSQKNSQLLRTLLKESSAEQLKLMNSEARQYAVVDAKVPVGEILALGGFDLRKVEHGVSGCSSQAFCATPQAKHHEHQIKSLSVAIDGEMAAEFFQQWIEGFIQLHAENLFRSKGIIAIRGCGDRLIFQGVHGVFRITMGEPWNDAPRQSRAIFIGRGLNRDEIIKGLASCKAQQ